MSKNALQVQVESREEWRQWLAENHATSNGIWLITYKKGVPEKYVSYDEIVEEALCFGWIDGLRSKFDDQRSMLYICPRRPGSPWSRLNKTRIEKLEALGLITPAGYAQIEQAKADGSWVIYDEVEDLKIPPDLAAALDADPTARSYFDAFSDSSKKGILWWIKSGKRDETRRKRIAETVRLAAQNLRANFPESRE
jgi:uncharacterized protein YdeI (YjbR/CyaY-like superfamily)